jgi:hypothetical protein
MEFDEENYKQCSGDWACLSARMVTKVNRLLGPRLVLETFRRLLRYCNGVTVPSQVVIAVALKRITPSSKEQK